MEEKSMAMELLNDYKNANKRMFIIIIVILSLWFMTIAYLVYVLNDISVVSDEYTQEITDVGIIEKSTISIGE